MVVVLVVHLPVHFLHVQQVIQRQIKAVVQIAARPLGKEFLNQVTQSIPVERETLMDAMGGVIISIAIEMQAILVHRLLQPMP